MNKKLITTICVTSLLAFNLSYAGREAGRRTSYTPSCLKEEKKSETIEKLEAIRRAIACRDNTDINYCMEYLGLGAIGVAGAAGVAAALKIRAKDTNICPFKHEAYMPFFWMDYAEARSGACMSKAEAAKRTDGLRRTHLQQALNKVNTDLDTKIQTTNAEIAKLEQEKNQIIKQSNNERLAKTEQQIQNRKTELDQLRSSQARLKEEANALDEMRRESRNKFASIESEYRRLEDKVIPLKNKLNQLEANDRWLVAEADHLDTPKGYLDYEDVLDDEVNKLKSIVQNDSEFKELVKKDMEIDSKIQTEYRKYPRDEDLIEQLKAERKEIESQKNEVASKVKSKPEYIKADERFNKRYLEVKARQHGESQVQELKGDSTEAREKSRSTRDEIKRTLLEKSEIDAKIKKLEPEMSKLKQEAERNDILHKERLKALDASNSQIKAKESEIEKMRTDSAKVDVDSKLVADKDIQIENRKAGVREAQEFKAKLAREIPDRELKNVNSNTNSIVDRFYGIAKENPKLMVAAANEHKQLLSLDASSDNLSLPRGTADINSRTMRNMKKGFGTFAKSAGIIGAILGVAGTASATDFAYESVATAGDCPNMDLYFSANVYEGVCTRDTLNFSEASERLLFLSNEDIFKQMSLDYNTKEGKEYYEYSGTYPKFKSMSEDFCKLVDTGYNKFYPKVTSVYCGPSSPQIIIRTKDPSKGTSEFIINDSNNFPAQSFSLKTGEDHFKMSLSQFGELTMASRASRTDPTSTYAMDLLSGAKNKDTFFGRSDAKQKLEYLASARSTLQDNVAMLTEIQACCKDSTPRPSTAECRRYGVPLNETTEELSPSTGAE